MLLAAAWKCKCAQVTVESSSGYGYGDVWDGFQYGATSEVEGTAALGQTGNGQRKSRCRNGQAHQLIPGLSRHLGLGLGPDPDPDPDREFWTPDPGQGPFPPPILFLSYKVHRTA